MVRGHPGIEKIRVLSRVTEKLFASRWQIYPLFLSLPPMGKYCTTTTIPIPWWKWKIAVGDFGPGQLCIMQKTLPDDSSRNTFSPLQKKRKYMRLLDGPSGSRPIQALKAGG